jgi:(1->4)-alpha-D-glucan 1-alpha-D-glucosylmutase
VRGWRERHRVLGHGLDPATEYLCYQTLVGVWPLRGAPDLDRLRQRVGGYLVKAAREDGRRTNWVEPDEPYERRLDAFVVRLLDQAASADFRRDLLAITRRTGEIAMCSSLSQVLLRTTSPGAPDTYQGQELWDDSLVDPDNRRPVDFTERRRLLEALDGGPVDLDDLVARRTDGRIKLWVLSRALRARAAAPGCFGPAGAYEALPAEGRYADRVVAFARSAPDGAAAVVIAPRLVGPLIDATALPPLAGAWQDTRVPLPAALAGRRWTDALGGGPQSAAELRLAEVLARLPVALLLSAPAG